MDKITRRKFLISTARGATGLGFIAGCNNRNPIGDDIRAPSAPKGVDGYVRYEQDGTKRAILSWDEHDLTDITGAPSETKIGGYTIYCEGKKLNTQLETSTSYADDKGPDNGGLQEGLRYSYHITATDSNGNESPASKNVRVKVWPPSKIYSVTNPNVLSGLTIDPDSVKTMLHAAVKNLTRKSTVAEAYEALFPVLNSSTKIAIKINCLAGNGLCTHPEVVEAIIDGLSQMLNSSFPVDNITVFDDRMRNLMNNAGFPLKNNPNDYKVLSTYGETSIFGPTNWSDTSIDISGNAQRFSNIAEEADYLINVPVLKDHSNAGITFALKNFYGVIDKPGNMHNDPNETHNTWCDPYIAGVYKIVADKVALIVGDAIFAVHKGGPSTAPTYTPKTLFIGTDPVAMDMHALKLINEERTKYNLYEITTEPDLNYPNRADARHIITASSDEYDLGTINKEIIEVER